MVNRTKNTPLRAGLLLLTLGLMAFGPPPAVSPVADAASRSDVAGMKTLLRSGEDVNAAQGDGMTALHWAAEYGDEEMAGMLIYAGAKLEPQTRIGSYTPLHLASKSGSAGVVRMLLEAGADVSRATTNSGTSSLHFAAASGSSEAINVLVEFGADLNPVENEWGQTPLMFAAAFNRAEAISKLLELGADPEIRTTVMDLRRIASLDRAAADRYNDALAGFRSEGQESAVMDNQDSDARVGPRARVHTAGEVQAATRKAREVYGPDFQLEEAATEDDGRMEPIRANGGLTALLHAVRQGHRESLAALLEGGADVNTVSAGDGTSPLLMATINGQYDLAITLLENGADPNIASELNGIAPLWAAINSRWQPRTRFPQPQAQGQQSHSYIDLMAALLENGADVNTRITLHPWYMVYTGCGNGNCGLVNTNGATAFWRAAYGTDLEAMKLLVSYGADTELATKKPPARRRFNRDAPSMTQPGELSDSARVARASAPWFLQKDGFKKPEEAKEDKENKNLVFATDPYDDSGAKEDASGVPPVPVGGPGVYPIHAAAGVGYGEGYAGNAHKHAPNGWVPSVKFLIEELGVPVDRRDFNGYTALHHAASRGDNDLVMYLVEQGADVMAVSRAGQTTADMANGPVSRVSPYPETVDLLVSLGAINNDNCKSC